MRPTPSTGRTESEGMVLVAGLVVLFAGVYAVDLASMVGWEASVLMGVLFIALAWPIATASNARVLRWLLAGLGVVALLVAAFDLLTGDGTAVTYTFNGGPS